MHGEYSYDGTLDAENPKTVPPHKNDLKKHLRHRDLTWQANGDMVRLLLKYPEPGVRHPSGREMSHHCLLQDLDAMVFTRSNSVLSLNA